MPQCGNPQLTAPVLDSPASRLPTVGRPTHPCCPERKLLAVALRRRADVGSAQPRGLGQADKARAINRLTVNPRGRLLAGTDHTRVTTVSQHAPGDAKPHQKTWGSA